jgi:hypothetical protein
MGLPATFALPAFSWLYVHVAKQRMNSLVLSALSGHE